MRNVHNESSVSFQNRLNGRVHCRCIRYSLEVYWRLIGGWSCGLVMLVEFMRPK